MTIRSFPILERASRAACVFPTPGVKTKSELSRFSNSVAMRLTSLIKTDMVLRSGKIETIVIGGRRVGRVFDFSPFCKGHSVVGAAVNVKASKGIAWWICPGVSGSFSTYRTRSPCEGYRQIPPPVFHFRRYALVAQHCLHDVDSDGFGLFSQLDVAEGIHLEFG